MVKLSIMSLVVTDICLLFGSTNLGIIENSKFYTDYDDNKMISI